MPLEDKCAQIWREAFQSAAAFASPSPRNGVHRRGDRIFSRMMDLEGEAIQQCDRELAKLHEANERMTNPNEPTLTCSEVVERLPMSAKEFGESMNPFTPSYLWLNSPFVNQFCAYEFAEAYAKRCLHSWRERRVQELEELLAKHSLSPEPQPTQLDTGLEKK